MTEQQGYCYHLLLYSDIIKQIDIMICCAFVITDVI